MSRAAAFLGWLEDKSDWLSPIVVKEVRQIVRGQEFTYSFSASLVAGLAVAFFGAADALSGNPTSGNWTFAALMGCLTLLGVAVVPLGAFSALRNERVDQTLELITLTALSPRRVVVGKLLAHAVKLATLFAAIAPFIAMSFLLGGVDFVTLLLSLLVLFLWSLWAIAACLFLSCLLKSRAMSGLVFGGAGLLLFVVFGLGRAMYFAATRGAMSFGPGVAGGAAGLPWRVLAIMTTACLATMVNLVLLAENRLALGTANRVTPLRVGFLVQFLLIAAWTLSFIAHPQLARLSAVNALGVLAGLHLAVVGMFTVTEGLAESHRAPRHASRSSWRWLRPLFAAGGGRGALYVLAQMALLLAAAWQLHPLGTNLGWFVAVCAYICFFTGVPTAAVRWLRPPAAALHVRVIVLVLLPLSMLVPDIVYYLLWRPAAPSLNYSIRHLANPIRTLSNWELVELNGWTWVPFAMGVMGVLGYVALLVMATRMAAARPAADPHGSGAAGEADSASALY